MFGAWFALKSMSGLATTDIGMGDRNTTRNAVAKIEFVKIPSVDTDGQLAEVTVIGVGAMWPCLLSVPGR